MLRRASRSGPWVLAFFALALPVVLCAQTLAPPPQASVLRFNGDALRSETSAAAPVNFKLTPSFTMSAWVFLQMASTRTDDLRSEIMGTEGNGLTAPWFFANLQINNGQYTFNVNYNDSISNSVIGGTVVLRQWTHVAATLAGSQMTLYVNGSAVATRALPGVPNTNANTGLFAIGANPTAAGYFAPNSITGAMKQVSVWSRALTADEIASYALVHLTGVEAGLAAYWPLDDETIASARDVTGHGFNLQLGMQANGRACPSCRPRFEPSSYETNPYFAVRVSAENVQSNEQGCVIDANGDGFPDVIVGTGAPSNRADPSSWPPQPIHVYVNDGGGNFSLGNAAVFGGQTITMISPTFGQGCVVADFDRDGRPDVFLTGSGPDTGDSTTATGEQSRLLMRRGTGLVDETSTRLPSEMRYTDSATLGDINNDGAIDIFVGRCCGGAPTSTFFVNDSNGHFAADYSRYPANTSSTTHSDVGSAALSDFNHDGYLDLAVVGAASLGPTINNYALLNDRTGRFAVVPNAVPPLPNGWVSGQVRAADFDGDGYSDLVMMIYDPDPAGPGPVCVMKLMINNRNATFRDASDRLPPLQLSPEALQNQAACDGLLVVTDVNGDGKPDIVFSGNTGRGIPTTLFIGTGDGHFVDATSITASFPWNNDALVADLDNDGKSDVLIVQGNGFLYTARQLRPFVVPPAALVPTLTALSPTFVLAGSKGATVTINGANLQLGATAYWNGSARPTEFVDDHTIAVALLATDLTNAGSGSLTVQNTGTAMSSALVFTVTALPAVNPVPVITLLAPGTVVAGSSGFLLTINGGGFVPTVTSVLWNGTPIAAGSVHVASDSLLTVDVPAGLIAVAGTATVVVMNPLPGGGTSSTARFFIATSSAALNTCSAGSLGQTRYWPEIVSGNIGGAGYVTKSTLTNLQNAATDVLICYYEGSLGPLANGTLLSTTSLMLAPAGTQRIQTPEAERFGALVYEWAVVKSSGPLATNLFFEIQNGAHTVVNVVGFNDALAGTAFTLPVELEPASPGLGIGRTVGISLANPNATSTAVTMRLFDASGNQVGGPHVETLAANATTLMSLQGVAEFQSAIPNASFIGSLIITATAPVTAIAVNDDLGPFSSMPLTPGAAK
jgi:hypothetical protein